MPRKAISQQPNRAQDTAAILTVVMPWIHLVTVLGFYALAPRLGVDHTQLLALAPIVQTILKK